MIKEKGNLVKIQSETSNIDMDYQLKIFLDIPRHRIVNSMLMKYCRLDHEIADVGCGNTCAQLRHLKTLGYTNLTGVDFNLNVKFDGINLVDQDLEEWKELPKKYDAIILADVIEHMRYPRYLLKNALSNLKEGGMVFISVPNAGHFYNGLLLTFFPRHLNMSSAFGPWGHYYFFTYFGLMDIFKKFDLEIIEYQASGLEFRHMSMHWIKRLAMWILNTLTLLFNFGPFRKYFSDHFYFVLRKKSDDYLKLPNKYLYE